MPLCQLLKFYLEVPIKLNPYQGLKPLPNKEAIKISKFNRYKMTDSTRLNAVEQELSAIREATLAFIQVANSNNEAIERMNQVIEQLAAGQHRTDEAIARLSASQDNLNQTMIQFAVNAENDRAEIRRIWEYLLGQQSNGHGRS